MVPCLPEERPLGRGSPEEWRGVARGEAAGSRPWPVSSVATEHADETRESPLAGGEPRPRNLECACGYLGCLAQPSCGYRGSPRSARVRSRHALVRARPRRSSPSPLGGGCRRGRGAAAPSPLASWGVCPEEHWAAWSGSWPFRARRDLGEAPPEARPDRPARANRGRRVRDEVGPEGPLGSRRRAESARERVGAERRRDCRTKAPPAPPSQRRSGGLRPG